MPATRSRLERLSYALLPAQQTILGVSSLVFLSHISHPKTLPKSQSWIQISQSSWNWITNWDQTPLNPWKWPFYRLFFSESQTTIASVAFNSALLLSSHASPWAGRFRDDFGSIQTPFEHSNGTASMWFIKFYLGVLYTNGFYKLWVVIVIFDRPYQKHLKWKRIANQFEVRECSIYLASHATLPHHGMVF